MPRANDRPLLLGTTGAITSGHYLATIAGYRIAEQGGNAIDIAAAVALCLSVLNQHEMSPGGESPILVYSAEDGKVHAISGVGWAPEALTIDWCRRQGMALIGNANFVPALVPSFIGTWALALQRFGSMSFTQVAQPALALAEHGFPLYTELRQHLLQQRDFLCAQQPTTVDVYLPHGRVPDVGERIVNADLAEVFRILCRAEADHAHLGRITGIDAVCDAFYRGPIAERIFDYISTTPLPDSQGTPQLGLLSSRDLAEWRATIEEPVMIDYRGLQVYKCPSWTQGPVFLQQLRLLEGLDLRAMGLCSAEYVHTVIECAKLAYADREAYYGDPAFGEIPMAMLLSRVYAAQRRNLISSEASYELRPGDVGHGIPEYVAFDPAPINRRALGLPEEEKNGNAGHIGDTSHLDVVDMRGNMVAATPSGGWLFQSPVIPGVGFPLGNRAQSFDLHPVRPNALAPRKRPRVTLTPSLATRDGQPFMAFGMRGGDLQDQRTLQFFLAHIEFGLPIQEALDVPTFACEHFPSSFYERRGTPGRMSIEDRVGEEVIEELRRRGHDVHVTGDQHHNTMCVQRDAHGVRAGVCSTGDEAYALVW